jgi:hypothetical protein
MLDIARSKGVTNVALGDAVSLDFPDESFDSRRLHNGARVHRGLRKGDLRDGARVQTGRPGRGGDARVAFVVGAEEEEGGAQGPGLGFRVARFYSSGELKAAAKNADRGCVVKGAIYAPPFDNAFCVLVGGRSRRRASASSRRWGRS